MKQEFLRVRKSIMEVSRLSMSFHRSIPASLEYAVAISIVVLLMMLLVTYSYSLTGTSVSSGRASFLDNKLPDNIPSDRLWFNVKLSKGKFLVASRRLLAPFFKETVILLLKYDHGGAMGLIINKPTEVKLSAVFPEINGLQKRADTVFLGGPVARNQMLMLIQSGNMPDESSNVFHNIYVSSSMAALKRMAGDSKKGEEFRLYNGYSGWTLGQLELEISRGDWHIINADAESIFKKDPSAIWPELILRSLEIQVRFFEK